MKLKKSSNNVIDSNSTRFQFIFYVSDLLYVSVILCCGWWFQHGVVLMVCVTNFMKTCDNNVRNDNVPNHRIGRNSFVRKII